MSVRSFISFDGIYVYIGGALFYVCLTTVVISAHTKTFSSSEMSNESPPVFPMLGLFRAANVTGFIMASLLFGISD